MVTSGRAGRRPERARVSAAADDRPGTCGDMKLKGRTDAGACAPLAVAERTDVPRMEWERAGWPKKDAKYARYENAMSENAEPTGRLRRACPRLLSDPCTRRLAAVFLSSVGRTIVHYLIEAASSGGRPSRSGGVSGFLPADPIARENLGLVGPRRKASRAGAERPFRCAGIGRSGSRTGTRSS